MIRSNARASAFFVAFRPALLLLLVALATVFAVPAAASPDPALVLTVADLRQELGGNWSSTSPEPGVVMYAEEGSGYRQVNVYLWPAAGKTVDAMKAQFVQEGEPVDDVPGVGDAAMYRPQRNEATVELKDKAGEVQWLSIAVQNAANAADTKRFAIALAKRGAERLKAL